MKYERRIAAEIRRAMLASARAIKQNADPEWVLLDHKTKLEQIMLPMYTDTFKTFVNYLTNIRKSRKDQTIDPTIIVSSTMGEWVSAYSSVRITLISETTRSQIRSYISQGIIGGLNEREIGKIIAKAAPTKSASRAQTIARTETHAAANATTWQTAKATGIEMTKEWVAANNSRTRESHSRISGKKVPMDDVFIVGGERMRYPSDPSASAEQTINCRCVLVYDLI